MNNNIARDSSNGPSALQKQHLQHIVGTGRNSVNAIEDGSGARNSLLPGSNVQGPFAQRRQNTGQKIIQNSSKSIRSTKAPPLSSQGRIPPTYQQGANSNQYRGQSSSNVNYDFTKQAGIPKPTIGSAAQRRSANRGKSSQQYNSTSAAGYQGAGS